MDGDILLESAVYALPWFLLAAIFYGFALWKKFRGQNLLSDARQLRTAGKTQEACGTYLNALWKANEEPRLEREILAELSQIYGGTNPKFRSGDYETLIVQFERLSKKGSHRAIAELKEVQSLKSHLIEQMRRAA
jgi:hypothetical protein